MIDIYTLLFLIASGLFMFNFSWSTVSAYNLSQRAHEPTSKHLLLGLAFFSGSVVLEKLFWVGVVALPLIIGHRVDAPWLRATLVAIWIIVNLIWLWGWRFFWRKLEGDDGLPLLSPAPIVEEPPPPSAE